MFIDRLRALDVEPANVLPVRLILITGHIVHRVAAVEHKLNTGFKYSRDDGKKSVTVDATKETKLKM